MNKVKKIDEAWLGIDIPDKDIFNPSQVLKASEDDFHL